MQGIFNIKVNTEDGSVVNETHYARVTPSPDEDCDCKKVPATETKFALMANLYVSEGATGKVCVLAAT